MSRCLFAVLALLVLPLGALPASAAVMLVVYPFAVSGTAPDDLGVRLANQIGAEVAGLGGVQVVRGAPSAKPTDYRSAARAAGADMYFSGSIIPVGTSYSAIEQLVSTHSGTVMWSVSFHFRTLDEVSGEGQRVRDELLRGEPVATGIAMTAGPLVTPPPMSGYAILPVTGSALDGDRQFTARVLVETLQHRGFKAVAVTAPIDPATAGAATCATTGAQTLIAGSLDTTRVASLGAAPQTTAHVALHTYDCRVHALDLQATVVNHIAPIANDAIRGAVEDAVSAFPAPS